MSDLTVEGWRLLAAVLAIIVAMGLFGGFVNFLLSAGEEPEGSPLRSISAGVAAPPGLS